jgi:hypothetical protein
VVLENSDQDAAEWAETLLQSGVTVDNEGLKEFAERLLTTLILPRKLLASSLFTHILKSSRSARLWL